MNKTTAVDANRVSRVLGIQVTFEDLSGGASFYLPPSIAVFAQGNTATVYPSDKRVVTSQGEVANTYGFGSPAHLIAQQLFPAFGDGVGAIQVTYFPLDDGTLAGEWTITPSAIPSAPFTAVVTVGGVGSQNVGIAAGTSVADMNTALAAGVAAVLDMPATAVASATEVTLTSKWQGTSANGIQVSVSGGVAEGVVFAVAQTQVASGNPSVATPLTLLGSTWHNLAINALEWGDTATLDLFQLAGEGRWAGDVHKPLAVFTATPETTLATLQTAGNLRKGDRINATTSVPGATSLPFLYAARHVVRIAQTMATNPARDYARLTLSGLPAGPESVQFDSDGREALVQAGISTVEVVAGVFEISDTVTYYHPDDEKVPGYRFIKDQVKVWNAVFNFRIEFNSSKWDGAPLLEDEDATENPDAKTPSDFKATGYAIIDALVRDAMATRAADIKKTFQVGITGPNRVDMKFTLYIAGNAGIIAVDMGFGFNFGAN